MELTKFSKEALHYYYFALIDLLSGEPIDVIEDQMREFEIQELYEACEGTKKALDLADRCTIKELQVEIQEVEIQIKNIQDED
jgi:hypothetical protein|tara:strand:+ start:1156 stop:1404 length:249 start_codon:yes stop_codon:yes gene_type:complete